MTRLKNINGVFHLYLLCSQLRPEGTAVEPRSQEAALQAADEEDGERGAGAGGGGRGVHTRYYAGHLYIFVYIACNIEPHSNINIITFDVNLI